MTALELCVIVKLGAVVVGTAGLVVVVLSDALSCFSAVQRAGCFHQPFVTGEGSAAAHHPALSWVNTILGNIKRSLHGSYHHVRSKHLPRYLAEFSYRFNRRYCSTRCFPAFPMSPCELRQCRTECSNWLRIMCNQVILCITIR